MKKMNKKGFTIVELVIVIAVIAVLAAVLIPTFGGMIDKAQQSNALTTAKNTHTQIMYTVSDFNTFDGYIEVDEKYYVEVEDGALALDANGNIEITETKPTAATGFKYQPVTIADAADGVVVMQLVAE